MLQLKQLVFFAIFCSSVALKGEHERSRSLNEGPPGKDWGDDWTPPPKKPKQPEKKVEHAGGKKDNNKGKKQAKGKKCEYETPPTKPPTKNWGRYLDETDYDDEEDEVMICKPFKKGGSCEKLEVGEDLTIPEDAEGTVEGSIKLEMSAKTDDAVEKMGKALKRAAMMTAGCNSRQRMLEAGDEAELEIGLEGISMDSDLIKVSDGKQIAQGAFCSYLRKFLMVFFSPLDCTQTNDEENCNEFESQLKVFYSGDATDLHIASMVTEFSSNVLDEAKNGAYEDFADVFWVEASSSSGLSSSLSSRNSEGGANVGAIVGGTIGGLALVGAVVGGVLLYKRRKAAVSPITVVDSEDGEGFNVNLFG